MKPDIKQTSRRRFLTTTGAAAAAPLVLPASRLFGADAPSKVVRLGHIGVGGRGTGLLRNFITRGGARSVAVADPFRHRRERAAELIKKAQGEAPTVFSDFRELLADPSIDAVVIATPDHWHVPIGLAAVRAGKDVYLEKPLGYTMSQNKAMLDACKKHDRVFQYGTQQRSQEIMKRGIELVLNGAIGEVERIEVWAPAGRGGGSLDEIPVPEGLDYDMYIGPAPMKPCTRDRITSKASWYCSDYAIGFIAGWGAHPLDISIWGMNHDQQGPYKLRGKGTFATPDALFDTLTNWDVDIEFAKGIQMRFMSDDIAKQIVGKYRKNWCGDGTTFFGPKGWVSLSRGGYAASNRDWFRTVHGADAKRVDYHKNYYQAFVDAVREHRPSVAPIEDAVRSDAMSHLSLLAIESGKEVVWDPKAYRIVSPEPLNQRMSRPVRGNWAQS
ncbi:MAG: Gfo/Idh/MocA family oxidoreductase [Verrucomicrobiae bacterium]|nr:Gfo/Idh/MocA family oxidoreductase [Verrucomicrobiae bacterium]NNJ87321.1 Gfo/Idh/MocA family oxidoreductase [Akkermansiaceae bacterium]